MNERAATTNGFARFRCCGVSVDATTLSDATGAVISRALARSGGAVHLCNAYTLSLASRDHTFGEVLNRGIFNFPDGMPLVWLGRRAGHIQMSGRVYGPDLMAAVCEQGRDVGLRHYLYGSTPEVIAALRRRLEARYPGLAIVGADSPPFRELTDDEFDETARRFEVAEAHVIWVGLGTPRQDWFVDRLSSMVDAELVAVGAAFDFHAGTLKQAPAWMQKRGLEWVYRLVREPRRLWRRYLVGNVIFLAGTLRSE